MFKSKQSYNKQKTVICRRFVTTETFKYTISVNVIFIYLDKHILANHV